MDSDNCVGAIVCKLDMHKNMVRRGYIAMLAVEKEYRRQKIGKLFCKLPFQPLWWFLSGKAWKKCQKNYLLTIY